MSDPTYVAAARALGSQLRARRKALGLTQSEVAELAGTTQRTVSVLESGKPTARLDVVSAVADALGLVIVAVDRLRARELGGTQSSSR